MTSTNTDHGGIRCQTPFDPLRVTRIEHDYADHPLLELDALRQLALRLHAAGTDKVKFIDPTTTQGSAFRIETADPSGRTIDEVFNEIETPGSWVAIYEAETVPEYRELIDAVMADARRIVDAQDPGLFDSDAFIFISSAPSVTPFHIDRENNFFLQIRGVKHVNVWQPDDRVTVPESGVEGWVARGSLAEVALRHDSIERAAVDDELGPGEGVYMPSTSGHTTRTVGRGVSISIGVVYYTRATRRRANIYAFNSLLRRAGWTPTGPRREGGVIDSIKFGLGIVSSRLLARVGKFTVQRGM